MSKQMGLLYAAVCFMLLVGCGSKQPKDANEALAQRTEEIEDKIKDHVESQQTQDHLLLLVLENKLNHLKLLRNFMDLQRHLRENPHWTRPELLEQVEEHRRERLVVLYEIAATRMEMRRLLTEEEWNLIFQMKSDETEGGES